MNAQVQSTEVAVIPPKPLTVIERAMSVFVGVPSEDSLRELAKGSATITAITNQAGWDQCHAARMVLKNTRLEIARTGESGREDAVQTSRSIIAIQKSRIAITQAEEDRLAAIEKAWDDRIAAEKEAKIQAEIERNAAIQRGIDRIRNWPVLAAGKSAEIILPMLVSAQDFAVEDAVFQERCDEAIAALAVSVAALSGLLRDRQDYEAAQAKLKRDMEELDQRRAADAERNRLAAAAQAKADADAKTERDHIASENAEKTRKERERNEAAMQEIQAIHHQLVIADTGRAPYCKGGDLESIDFAIDGTEKWELTEERFGALYAVAVKAKENTLAALRDKRLGFFARQANAAETKRLADQQAEIDRQQEAIRVANLPKPKPPKTLTRPTAAQLVALVSAHYSVSLEMAEKWLRKIKWADAA